MDMDGLFPCGTLSSFGPSCFDPAPDLPPLHQVAAGRAKGLRVLVREQGPRHAGVYGMIDANGQLIYVGKAKCLRSRLLSYFRSKSRDPKAGRILKHARVIAWERTGSEFAALLRELELIRRWRPRFNVQGQPGRFRPVYLCMGRSPAPYLFIAPQPPKGVVGCYGPLSGSWRVREAVRWLNDWFGLRDCPQHQEMVFADQVELFPIDRNAGCLRYEIGTCLGPCLAACSRQTYMKRVRQARAFLEGKDQTPLAMLESQMLAASAELAFERAAARLEKLESFRWLHERLARLREARAKQSFIYPAPGKDGRDIWYLIHGGRVLKTLFAPRLPGEHAVASSEIKKAFAQKRTASGPLPPGDIDSFLLVAAWFRKHPQEKACVFTEC
jgi:excinuclease ABC subunit C